MAAVGSGGTFIGTSWFLKSVQPETVCAVVEPQGAAVLAGERAQVPRHLLQGAGYGIVPAHWRPDLVDVYLTVSDEEAARYRHLLAAKEGLYVGYSAAANVRGAVKLLTSGRLPDDARVGTVLTDTGLKY